MKHRVPLILGGVSVALVLASSFGSGAGAAGSAVSPSGVPVLLPASALAPTHAGGMRPPIGYLPLHAREFAAQGCGQQRGGREWEGWVDGGRGRRVVSSYENVSPSFDGIYQTDRHAAGYHRRDRSRPVHRDREHLPSGSTAGRARCLAVAI